VASAKTIVAPPAREPSHVGQMKGVRHADPGGGSAARCLRARLRSLVSRLGSPLNLRSPRSSVSIEQEIRSGRIQNGVYRGTLPAYDPILPVTIQLIDEKGNLVASASESVRQPAPPSVRWGRRRAHHVSDTESIGIRLSLRTGGPTIGVGAVVTSPHSFAARRRSVRHAGSAVVLFLVSIAVIAISSCLYRNRLWYIAYAYTMSTTLHSGTSCSCSTVSCAFCSLEPTQMTAPRRRAPSLLKFNRSRLQRTSTRCAVRPRRRCSTCRRGCADSSGAVILDARRSGWRWTTRFDRSAPSRLRGGGWCPP